MKRISLLLTCCLPFMFAGCSTGGGDVAAKGYTAFANPEKVTIVGYDGNASEPFISRDGAYLFFNDFDGADQKDLYYATYIDPTTFQFQGALTTINTPELDGAPTMDLAGRFYYITTSGYNPPASYDTIYSGTWDGGAVTGSAPITGLAIAQPGMLNFDVEVSPDGSTLYFNDGDFSNGTGIPRAANIAVAFDTGSGFERVPDSATIMANINTSDLEYAPGISADGLELFFTRLNLGTMQTRIYRAERPDTDASFGVPQPISAIEGFVEGPSLSPDGKSLYYHKQDPVTGHFDIFRVTRP